MLIKPLYRRIFAGISLFSGLFALPVHQLSAAAYQDAVNALSPSFYYQLNETSTAGGCIDSTGHALPGTFNGDYVNGPPMVGGAGPLEVFGGLTVPGVGGTANLAHYSNNAGNISLGPKDNYGANAITVALFFKAGGTSGGDRLFTNNIDDPTKSFQIDVANDGLVMSVDQNQTGEAAERTLYLEDNSNPDRRLIDPNAGWFHIVASTHGDTGPERAANLRIWVNGVDRTSNLKPNATGWGVAGDVARIGGREADPTHSTTHSGAQDEVAIWLNRVLTDAEITSLWDAARGIPNYAKTVFSLSPSFYYQLNETSTTGGCIDSTGHALPGTFNGDYVNGPPKVGGEGPLEVFGGISVPGAGGAANLAHYSNNAGNISLGPKDNYGANAITVALFFKAGGTSGGDRLFTNNIEDPTKSFQVDVANDGLVMSVDQNQTGELAERTLYLEDNSNPDRRLIDPNSGWFHIVASTHGDTGPDRAANLRIWVNGVDRTLNLKPNATGWGVAGDVARIGGREADPLHSTTHSGAQDEVAIWLDRELTDTEAKLLWTAATTTTGPPGIRSVTLKNLRRNLNGTAGVLTDDTVDFTITVTGSGSPAGWVVSGPAGSSLVGKTDTYGTAHAFTAVPIADFPGGSMVLTVKDAADPSLTGSVTITVPVTLVDWTQAWDYMNPMGTFPDSPGGGIDPDFDTTWFLKASDFATQYNGPTFGGAQVIGDPNTPNTYDSGSGPGPLGYDTMDYWNTLGAQFIANGTALTAPLSVPGSRYSTYLRTTFTVPNDGKSYTRPAINYLIDDGGFVYLDGELILTGNINTGVADTYLEPAANATDTENQLRTADLTLPAGTLTGGLATTGVTNATIVKPVTTLAPGVHTLAVSVHNATNASSDQGFALQLTSVTTGGGGGEGDTDGDGVSDANEGIMGTNPNNANDVLRLTQNPATPTQIQFPSKAGKFYRVYSSTDLLTWTGSGTTLTGDGSVKQFVIVTTGGTRRSYRLHVMSTDGPWAP
jgi:hypothetical protein